MFEDIVPTRLLDAAIHTRLFGPVLTLNSGMFINDGMPVPLYSSSVDAALSLAQALIPAWSISIRKLYGRDEVLLEQDRSHPLSGQSAKLYYPRFVYHDGKPADDLHLPDMHLPREMAPMGIVSAILCIADAMYFQRKPLPDGLELISLYHDALHGRQIEKHPLMVEDVKSEADLQWEDKLQQLFKHRKSPKANT